MKTPFCMASVARHVSRILKFESCGYLDGPPLLVEADHFHSHQSSRSIWPATAFYKLSFSYCMVDRYRWYSQSAGVRRKAEQGATEASEDSCSVRFFRAIRPDGDLHHSIEARRAQTDPDPDDQAFSARMYVFACIYSSLLILPSQMDDPPRSVLHTSWTCHWPVYHSTRPRFQE